MIAFRTLINLINVRKSRVAGFKVSAAWRPVEGLTFNPVLSFTETKVRGQFLNFDHVGAPADFGGRAFALVPKLQISLDAEWSEPRIFLQI